jgi:RNA polymerase sigma-70 factor (ECF subfamily)
MGLTKEETEEVVMDTFFKFNGVIDSYDPKYSVKTLLFRIAYNGAIDAIRRKSCKSQPKNFYEIGNDYTSFEHKYPVRSFEETLIEKQERRNYNKQLRNIVYSLGDRERTLIVLHYFRGLPYKVLAEITNTPIGVVKAQLFRARQKLKPKLEYARAIY